MSDRAVARWWTVHHPVLEAVPEDVWPDRADEIAAEIDRMVDLIEGVVGRANAAALVGVSTSTSRRWRTGRTSPSATNAERLTTVADTVAQLRHSFTPGAVVAWFDRPRHQLDGQRPADLLDDPAQRARIVTLASGSRDSIAT